MKKMELGEAMRLLQSHDVPARDAVDALGEAYKTGTYVTKEYTIRYHPTNQMYEVQFHE